jgi:GNAT superfamily N-acetyltransferase
MGRNTFVKDDWILKNIEDLAICGSFDCDDDDLNEYFHEDVKWHREELLTQTYCLYQSTAPKLILALLDFCNDVIKVQYPFVGIDPRIHYPFLPAVKLTRIGVVKELQGNNIGTHALNLVKQFFTTDNRTGCRFITVDAYNTPRVMKFYEKNGFNLLTDTDKGKNTRSLFFDLKRFKNI